MSNIVWGTSEMETQRKIKPHIFAVGLLKSGQQEGVDSEGWR